MKLVPIIIAEMLPMQSINSMLFFLEDALKWVNPDFSKRFYVRLLRI